MTTLLVGFDSAWTPTNSGALVGGLHFDDGTFLDLGAPQIVDYREAESAILKWHGRVTGFLLFDSEHFIRNHLVRVNNWEIHPVLGLEFCTTGNTCKANSDAGWSRLTI